MSCLGLERVAISARMGKSIWVTIIERSPKIILAVAVLICVIRAKPGDLPKIVENLAESDIFSVAGWVVAATLVVIGGLGVWLYIRLKPKKPGS